MLIIFVGQPGANRHPADTATATSHGVTVPSANRPTAARAAARIAVTASAHPPPAGPGSTGSGSNARNHQVNTARTASARPANRRNQPRTVSAGQPRPAAIRRNPTPRAFATNADPITDTVSARRGSATTGNNTCVTPQPVQRDRRGHSGTGPARPRSVRHRA